MRNVFGSSLPPGVTQRMIDDAAGFEAPCPVCGLWADRNCICTECSVCGEIGNPLCYEQHGMVRTAEQIANKAEMDDEAAKQAAQEREMDNLYAAELELERRQQQDAERGV